MELIDWTKLIIRDLDDFTDEEFQSRVWLRGEGPEASSFTEAVCGLYDDHGFDKFVESARLESMFGENELLVIENFRVELHEFISKTGTAEDDEEIINDSKWPDIVNGARVVRNILLSKIS